MLLVSIIYIYICHCTHVRTFSEVAPNEPVKHVRHSADCSFNRQQADDHGFSMRLFTDLECRTVISLYFPPDR